MTHDYKLITSWGPSFDKICHLYASDNDSSYSSSCNNKKLLIIDQSSAKMNTLKLNRMAIKDDSRGNFVDNNSICTKHKKATIADVETKIGNIIQATSVS